VSFRFITGDALPVADTSALSRIPKHHLITCFGCGPENPHRLGIEPRYTDDRVVAEMAFHPRFEGGPGLAHGGAVAALFDDLLGFVAMMHQRPAVTAKLEVNYRHPIPLGVTIRSEAWLTAVDGRKLSVEGAGFAPDGTVLVEVVGLFIAVGAEHFTKAIEGVASPYPDSMYESDEYYP
jgi:uncharacterized protein (TIGR00369 family)